MMAISQVFKCVSIIRCSYYIAMIQMPSCDLETIDTRFEGFLLIAGADAAVYISNRTNELRETISKESAARYFSCHIFDQRHLSDIE